MTDQYLTHERYKELGGELSVLDFNRKEFTARKKIDAVTHGRIRLGISDETKETIEMLILELIKQNMVGTMKGRKRSSESNNGLSVSYADDKGEAENLIRTYLANEQTTDGVPLINPSIMTARVLRT